MERGKIGGNITTLPFEIEYKDRSDNN